MSVNGLSNAVLSWHREKSFQREDDTGWYWYEIVPMIARRFIAHPFA